MLEWHLLEASNWCKDFICRDVSAKIKQQQPPQPNRHPIRVLDAIHC